MKTPDFFRGMCIGLALGTAVDMVLCGGKTKKCRTAAGKAMQRMGCAMDSAMQDISSMLK